MANSAPVRHNLRPVDADDSKLCAYLDGLVDELRRLVPPALTRFDEQAIHKSRVATRRLKAALDLLEPVLSDAQRKPMLKIGRKLRRRLGPLRDFDVMLGHLQKIRSRKHADAVAWVVQRLMHQRDDSRGKAADAPDAGRVLGKLGVWWGVREQILEAQDAIPSLLSESLHLQLDRFAEQAHRLALRPRAAGQTTGSESALDAASSAPLQSAPQDPHELRIAGKALRYTLELAQAGGHALDARLLKGFKRMQDALGAWHDMVVLTERIMQLSLETQLPLHDPTMQSKLLELARFTLARASSQLDRFGELWAQSGDMIASSVREAFPLTRDEPPAQGGVATAEVGVETTITESQTDHGPSGSGELTDPGDGDEAAPPAA